MKPVIHIVTERPAVVLTQLSSEADDAAYYEALDASRAHLMEFEEETLKKYPDLNAVRQARLHPDNPNKLRFGIWDDTAFVGSINLVPDGDKAEVGYWLHVDHTGRGYATIAAGAVAKYAAQRYKRVFATVTEGNDASARVLERAGFVLSGRTILAATQLPKLIFDLSV